MGGVFFCSFLGCCPFENGSCCQDPVGSATQLGHFQATPQPQLAELRGVALRSPGSARLRSLSLRNSAGSRCGVRVQRDSATSACGTPQHHLAEPGKGATPQHLADHGGQEDFAWVFRVTTLQPTKNSAVSAMLTTPDKGSEFHPANTEDWNASKRSHRFSKIAPP